MSFEAAILKFYLELKRYAEADLELLQHPMENLVVIIYG